MNEFSPIFVSALNAILMVALPALAVAAFGALMVWSRKVWNEIKAQQPSLADQIEMYVKIAVQAAEQAGAAKLIESKKAYAIKVVYAWLEEIGLQGINVELIEAEIERQVGEMKKEEKMLLALREDGQGMVEYALILVLVAVVVIAAVTVMGPLVGQVFSTVNASLGAGE